MTTAFPFTFSEIERQYAAVQELGYRFVTCEQFASSGAQLVGSTVVHRVDIDFHLDRAERLAEIYARLGIKASFFVRLHAPEYNPMSFEGLRILKAIAAAGHEIGYHSEIVDGAAVWDEPPATVLRRDLAILEALIGRPVVGVASHGGNTGLNNLDFWSDHKPEEFGLLYEAYDRHPRFDLFHRSFYVSDSEWTRWKCYDRGVLVEGDRRSFAEHARDAHPLIYLLVHADTYYDRHPYE